MNKMAREIYAMIYGGMGGLGLSSGLTYLADSVVEKAVIYQAYLDKSPQITKDVIKAAESISSNHLEFIIGSITAAFGAACIAASLHYIFNKDKPKKKTEEQGP